MNPFYVVPITIPIFFVAITFFLSKTVWNRFFPPEYRMPADQARPVIATGSLYAGKANYTNCIRISVHPEGIGLCPIIPFRLFHPPVCVPWTRIHHIDSLRQLFGQAVVISFDQDESLRLVVRKKAYEQSILPMMNQAKEKASL